MFHQQEKDPHQHVHVQLSQAAEQGATRASLHLHEDHIMLVDNRPLNMTTECRTRLAIDVRPPGSRWQLLALLSAHPAPATLRTTLVFHQDAHATVKIPMRQLRDRVAFDMPDHASYLTPADALSPITIVQPSGASHQVQPYGVSEKPGIHRAAALQPNQTVRHQTYALVHTPPQEIPFPPSPIIIADLHAQLVIATLQLTIVEAETSADPVWPDANTLALAAITPRYLSIPPRVDLIGPYLRDVPPTPSTSRRRDDPNCLRLTPENAYVPAFPSTHEQDLIRMLGHHKPMLVPVHTQDPYVPRMSLAGITIETQSGARSHHPATPENDPSWPGLYPPTAPEIGVRRRHFTFRIREQGARSAEEFTITDEL